MKGWEIVKGSEMYSKWARKHFVEMIMALESLC